MYIFDTLINAFSRVRGYAGEIFVRFEANNPLITSLLKPRLRVDVGQTGFFEGREFRTFKELDIPTGTTYMIVASVPVNIILQSLQIVLDSGQVNVDTFVGGTPSGTLNETLPIIPCNNMTERPFPYYVPVVTIGAVTSGGSLAGGVQLDVIRLKVENASGQAASVGETTDDVRGVAANTYYILIPSTGTGAAKGTFKARWEERP